MYYPFEDGKFNFFKDQHKIEIFEVFNFNLLFGQLIHEGRQINVCRLQKVKYLKL